MCEYWFCVRGGKVSRKRVALSAVVRIALGSGVFALLEIVFEIVF